MSSTNKIKFYDRKKYILESLLLIFLILMILIAIFAYPLLSDKVPMHWNAKGEIDGYGSKEVLLFLVPTIYLLFLILGFFLPIMDVYKDNINSFYLYYYSMKVLFGTFFLAIYILTIMPNFNYKFDMTKIILYCTIALFFGLGHILRHVKRNFFIGIRTPWTLTSERIWDRTHDIGGKLFMIFSILIMILSFFLQSEMLFFTFMSLLIVMVIGITIYSYVLYRGQQNL